MKRILLLLIVLVAAGVFGAAQARAADRVIDDSDTVILPGNVHPLARPEFDTGRAPSSLPMERMILVLKRSADKQAELDRFLSRLHEPSSPDFHQWLTPEEFGKRFGPSPEDIDAVTGWLTSHGFVVEAVAKGKSWINFSGTVADVEAAFHTSIHTYQVGGRLYHANAEDPSIPRGLADVVAGVVSLNDFPRKAMHSDVLPAKPDYTSGSTHYLSPGDFATIYDVNALYSSGINGTGQSIAIVGRTHPSGTDWATFRSTMGLPANPPQVIVNGRDPGDLGGNEDVEADLDVEWSGAVAKNATIKFVVSKSTRTTDGVDLSAQYIVNNNLAPVMSTSFGSCESDHWGLREILLQQSLAAGRCPGHHRLRLIGRRRRRGMQCGQRFDGLGPRSERTRLHPVQRGRRGDRVQRRVRHLLERDERERVYLRLQLYPGGSLERERRERRLRSVVHGRRRVDRVP